MPDKEASKHLTTLREALSQGFYRVSVKNITKSVTLLKHQNQLLLEYQDKNSQVML